MRAFLGFILGVILTVACAYAYDSSTGRIGNGLTSVAGEAPLVNWNIVSDRWQNLQTKVRVRAENLENTLKQHTG